MATIEIPEALYIELIEWFEKFSASPLLHDQGLPQRLNDAAHQSIKARRTTVPPTPTREQIEAFRKEQHIPDDGKLEPWAIEENMVLNYLCTLALEREAFPPEVARITEAEAAQFLDDGFSIKVLNAAPESGHNGGKNYWRCPHCGMADFDGHEQSCVIRTLVERLLGRHIPFGQLSIPSPQRRIDLRKLYSESRLALFGMFDDCDEERWQILREMERRLHNG